MALSHVLHEVVHQSQVTFAHIVMALDLFTWTAICTSWESGRILIGDDILEGKREFANPLRCTSYNLILLSLGSRFVLLRAIVQFSMQWEEVPECDDENCVRVRGIEFDICALGR